MRRVVDDEVHTGEVLERPDVATLPPDDPALHVVGGKLHDGHRRLGGVTRRDALQCVGDEVSRPALRLRTRFVLERPHAARELVPRLLFPTLEEQRPCLGLRQPRHALELGELGLLRLLELLLELANVLLPVGDALVAARELLELLLDLGLFRQDALLDLQHLCPPVGQFRVDLAAQADSLLAGLDLRLTPHSVALAARIVEQLVADPAGFRHSCRAEDRDREQRESGAYSDPDGNSDSDQHVLGSSVGDQAATRGTSHPAPGLRRSYPRSRIPAGKDRPESRCATSRATSESSGLRGRSSDVVSEKLLLQAKRRIECSGILPRLTPPAQTTPRPRPGHRVRSRVRPGAAGAPG